MTVQIPGIDAEKGLDLYDDDMEIYLSVLHSYISNTPAVLDKLRTVSAETLQDYFAGVHGVKGTSASIGAEDLRNTAAKLEAMARAGDLSGVLAQNDAFIKYAATIVDNIKSWLAKYDAGH